MISWPKLFLLCIIICLVQVSSLAQRNKGNYNFYDFEGKSYYFGLTFGYNHSGFQLYPSSQFIGNDQFNVVQGLSSPGLNVSLVGNMKLGKYFDFRFLPGFSFTERKILYLSAVNEVGETRNISSVLMQAPLQVRFKSDPFHDMRVYVLAGAKYTYDGSPDLRPDQAMKAIRISPHDFPVEVGAGMQFFMPFFILSPEIKYSQGFGNILIYNNDLQQTKVLEKILSRAFTISLHFEG